MTLFLAHYNPADTKPVNVDAVCLLARTFFKGSERYEALLDKGRVYHQASQDADAEEDEPYEDNPDYNYHAVFNNVLEELINADEAALTEFMTRKRQQSPCSESLIHQY